MIKEVKYKLLASTTAFIWDSIDSYKNLRYTRLMLFHAFKTIRYKNQWSNCVFMTAWISFDQKEMFDGVQVQTVAQPPWERMNAEIPNCYCRICDKLVNR